jgi:opacity protein-like surface antigen
MKKIMMAMMLIAGSAFAGGVVQTTEQGTQLFVGINTQKNFIDGMDNDFGIGGQIGFDKVYSLSIIDFGVEARVNRVNTDGEHITTYTGLVKAGVDVGNVTPYVLGGYGITDASQVSGSDDSFVYGFGAKTKVYDNVDLFADYVVNTEVEPTCAFNNTNDFKTLTVGVNYRF